MSFIDTGGHFLTTDGNSLGINVDIDKKVFYPEYIVSTSELSKNKVSALRTRIKACLDSGGKILLMTDNDRAGDHIAWEVIEHFKLKDGDWLRSGITTPKEKDFMKALDALKPELHIGRLESERARMVLDKCFGYIQSPHLWNKIKKVEAKHIEALRDGTQQMLEEFKEENKAVMHEARVKDFVSFVEGIIEEVGTFAGDKSEIIKSSIGRVQIPMLRLVMDTFLESFGKIKVVNNIRVTDGNGFNWKFAPTTESAESLEDGVTE